MTLSTIIFTISVTKAYQRLKAVALYAASSVNFTPLLPYLRFKHETVKTVPKVVLHHHEMFVMVLI